MTRIQTTGMNNWLSRSPRSDADRKLWHGPIKPAGWQPRWWQVFNRRVT